MTMIVYDHLGIAHEVYNKREVREIHATYRRIEQWQIRTLCKPRDLFTGIEPGIAQADLDDTERSGSAVTCLLCVQGECDHGISFDAKTAEDFKMASHEVRERWPRLAGECPKGCGYSGIAYASYKHYVYGDW